MRDIRRGEIYLMKLPDGIGSEQRGYRPVLIISNNIANRNSDNVTVAPITSRVKNVFQPTHVVLKHMGGLEKYSMVMCEMLGTYSKERLGRYIGRLNRRYMKSVDEAVTVAIMPFGSRSQACDSR